MEKYQIKTCGIVIQKARISKNMTIQDLTKEINNRKKKYDKEIDEKTIMQWESSKSYPDLEMCYQLAYILDINPSELLNLRNYERKKFKVKKIKQRTFLNSEVPDEFFWFLKGILGLALIMIAFYIVIQVKKLENAVVNGGGEEFEKVLVNEVDKNINQIENDVNTNII